MKTKNVLAISVLVLSGALFFNGCKTVKIQDDISSVDNVSSTDNVHTHDMVVHNKEEATCTSDGKEKYYECKDCGKLYLDEAGTNEVTADQIVIKGKHNVFKNDAEAATCTKNGNIEFYFCSTCHKYFLDEECQNEVTLEDVTTPALGHTMEETSAVSPTCESDGTNRYYTCTTCNNVYKDENATTPTTIEAEKLSKLGHDITIHEKEYPTAEKPITVAEDYYECEECHQKWSDEELQNPITDYSKYYYSKLDNRFSTSSAYFTSDNEYSSLVWNETNNCFEQSSYVKNNVHVMWINMTETAVLHIHTSFNNMNFSIGAMTIGYRTIDEYDFYYEYTEGSKISITTYASAESPTTYLNLEIDTIAKDKVPTFNELTLVCGDQSKTYTVYNGSCVEGLLNSVNIPNAIINGFYTLSGSNHVNWNKSNKITTDTTIYCDYTSAWLVNFANTGDTTIVSQNVLDGQLPSLDVIPVENDDSRVFDYWCTDVLLTQKYNNEPITANTTLYAKWTPRYVVTYMYGTKTIGSDKGTGGKPYITSQPKNFEIFVEGYYTDSEFNNEFVDGTILNGNITLYAKEYVFTGVNFYTLENTNSGNSYAFKYDKENDSWYSSIPVTQKENAASYIVIEVNEDVIVSFDYYIKGLDTSVYGGVQIDFDDVFTTKGTTGTIIEDTGSYSTPLESNEILFIYFNKRVATEEFAFIVSNLKIEKAS